MVKDCNFGVFCEATIEVESRVAGEVWLTIDEQDYDNYPCRISLNAEGVEELIRDLRRFLPLGFLVLDKRA